MKALMLMLVFFSISSPLWAQEEQLPTDTEIIANENITEENHIPIREVKDLVRGMSQQNTCLDEYLQRRKQYIAKLSLVPVTATVAIMGSLYTGGMLAAGVATATGVEGWAGLGYVIGGAAIGAVSSAAFLIYDTTKSSLDMVDNNLMIKALAEYYLNRPGPKTDKLYEKYLKLRPANPLSKSDLIASLIAADEDGTLCDGSMVKQPKMKIGFKLKYKLAKSKDFLRKLK